MQQLHGRESLIYFVSVIDNHYYLILYFYYYKNEEVDMSDKKN